MVNEFKKIPPKEKKATSCHPMLLFLAIAQRRSQSGQSAEKLEQRHSASNGAYERDHAGEGSSRGSAGVVEGVLIVATGTRPSAITTAAAAGARAVAAVSGAAAAVGGAGDVGGVGGGGGISVGLLGQRGHGDGGLGETRRRVGLVRRLHHVVRARRRQIAQNQLLLRVAQHFHVRCV